MKTVSVLVSIVFLFTAHLYASYVSKDSLRVTIKKGTLERITKGYTEQAEPEENGFHGYCMEDMPDDAVKFLNEMAASIVNSFATKYKPIIGVEYRHEHIMIDPYTKQVKDIEIFFAEVVESSLSPLDIFMSLVDGEERLIEWLMEGGVIEESDDVLILDPKLASIDNIAVTIGLDILDEISPYIQIERTRLDPELTSDRFVGHASTVEGVAQILVDGRIDPEVQVLYERGLSNRYGDYRSYVERMVDSDEDEYAAEGPEAGIRGIRSTMRTGRGELGLGWDLAVSPYEDLESHLGQRLPEDTHFEDATFEQEERYEELLRQAAAEVDAKKKERAEKEKAKEEAIKSIAKDKGISLEEARKEYQARERELEIAQRSETAHFFLDWDVFFSWGSFVVEEEFGEQGVVIPVSEVKKNEGYTSETAYNDFTDGNFDPEDYSEGWVEGSLEFETALFLVPANAKEMFIEKLTEKGGPKDTSEINKLLERWVIFYDRNKCPSLDIAFAYYTSTLEGQRILREKLFQERVKESLKQVIPSKDSQTDL